MDNKLNNLEALHDAIRAGLARKLPRQVTVEHYPKVERRINMPAVLFELSEFEPGRDPGTGEAGLLARFQARAIVDPIMAGADMAVRELAARIAVAIQSETWGLPIGMAQFMQSGEDGMKPELDGYLVWLVEWSHEIVLGEMEWPYPDESGRSLWLGIDPDTGAAHKADYWPAGTDPLLAGGQP